MERVTVTSVKPVPSRLRVTPFDTVIERLLLVSLGPPSIEYRASRASGLRGLHVLVTDGGRLLQIEAHRGSLRSAAERNAVTVLPGVPVTVAVTMEPNCALMVEATVAAVVSAGVKLYVFDPTTSVYMLRLPAGSGVSLQEAPPRTLVGVAPEGVWTKSRFMDPRVSLWSEIR